MHFSQNSGFHIYRRNAQSLATFSVKKGILVAYIYSKGAIYFSLLFQGNLHEVLMLLTPQWQLKILRCSGVISRQRIFVCWKSSWRSFWMFVPEFTFQTLLLLHFLTNRAVFYLVLSRFFHVRCPWELKFTFRTSGLHYICLSNIFLRISKIYLQVICSTRLVFSKDSCLPLILTILFLRFPRRFTTTADGADWKLPGFNEIWSFCLRGRPCNLFASL